jgi:Tol biopolymer transport system component
LSTLGRPDRYVAVRIAPDGGRAYSAVVDAQGKRDLWLIDLARGLPSRLTNKGRLAAAIWSSQGDRLIYEYLDGVGLYAISADGADQESLLLQTDRHAFVNDMSADGRFVVYSQVSSQNGTDLWFLHRGDPKPTPFLVTPFNEFAGQVSPNGKWIAFISDESGRDEIYVRSFPTSGSKWPVSSGGGGYPRWRRDGMELFYLGLDGVLMVVPVRRAAAEGLDFGAPAKLPVLINPVGGAYAYPYDISPDGQSILALAPVTDSRGSGSLTLLMNWEIGLKK